MMRSILIVAILLSIAAAYYIYLPLPSTISEPWKLMFMDAILRGVMHASFLAHDLGLSRPFDVAKYAASWDEIKGPQSSPAIRVTDTHFGGVEAQVFESTASDQERHLKRGVVYFHGGGWTLGSGKMQTYFLQCRTMAEELDAVVISIEYSLAPDARFPDQYNEAIQSSKHILTAEVLGRYHIDPKRVAVSGDSAGANLATAVVQQMALDSSVPIQFKVQALLYPVLQALDFNTPSYQQNAHIPILHRPIMARFWLEYLNGDPRLVTSLLANNHTTQGQEMAAARAKINWTKLLPVAFQKNYKPVVPLHGDPELLEKLPGLLDVRAAPLLAETEVLKALPPAYIMTCEHDVLRDDGLMYATRLKEAGVRVTVDHYEDGFHGCLSFAFGPFRFSVGFRSFRNYICWLKENL
ncbi:neutral cholesterol ester hydrolase 1 isoform X1 [Rhinichthys klamathensis goyatoka]|uniref:neutral cholesterol ester hydrolase 1 isoform X1 n=2 Tax=Rhinichthys klamathensis goyatoka TaxID=3034132 RepID=UPI0024B575A2|nr:neutral cholesterol ester hydrolase 1 isoform X1 [Rhinichthys klamathensis goyatoka]